MRYLVKGLLKVEVYNITRNTIVPVGIWKKSSRLVKHDRLFLKPKEEGEEEEKEHRNIGT